MPTINKELEALSLNDIHRVSERFLMGWHDPKYDGYSFRIKGLNHYRAIHGLQPLTKEWSQTYRIQYIKSHYSDDEIEAAIRSFCETHSMADERWSGIELLDCRFGREYAKLFKELLGSARWRRISESTRVQKLTDTQTERYGGIGVAGKAAYDKMLETKINRNRALKHFESIGEEMVYDMLIEKFGTGDVIYQYGVHPYDARYPYSCDFYIKSCDLFIELNTHYSHSDHWFDENNKADVLKVSQWESGSKCYKKLIHQWTETDVKKRAFAKANHLKYLVFWDGKHRRNKDKRYAFNYVPVLSDFRKWYFDYGCNTDAFLRDNPHNTY